MDTSQVLKIIQDALYLILLVSLPMLATALIIGIVISIFQATTQINEQTLAFVPKIIGIFLSIIFFGNWIINKLVDYTNNLFNSINTIVK